MRRTFILAKAWPVLLVALLMGLPSSRAADVFLGVTRSETAKIPLSLLYVETPSVLLKHSSQIRTVLEGDLRRSQVFDVIHPPPYAELAGGDFPSQDLITRVGEQGIQAGVWISLARKGEDFILEGQVYDGKSGQRVMGKRYTGEAKHLRSIIHRFSDDIVLQYTGERGIAQTRVIYSSNLTGNKELYLMDYDGYNVRRITNDRSLNLSPKWSPDGKWITYTSYRNGNPAIYTLDLAAGRVWKVVEFAGLNISPAWSPGGDFLVFASTRTGSAQIYRVKRDGSDLQRLTVNRSDNLSPSWSPTGGDLAFTSNRGGTPQIYIMGMDGTNIRRLTFNGRYNTSPAWSPKGNAIAYTCRVDSRLRICVSSPDGSEVAQLTDGPGEDESPTWSPDGRHIIFSSTRESRGDLYGMNPDGSGLERLTFNGAKNNSPSWSP